MTPADVRHGRAEEIHEERARVLAAAYGRTPERFVETTAETARDAYGRVDQQTRHAGGCTLKDDCRVSHSA